MTIPGTGDEIAATDRVVLPVAHISSQRLEPYSAHAFGDESKSLELYTWGRELSAALFRDISIQRFLAATSRVEQVLAADPRIGWG